MRRLRAGRRRERHLSPGTGRQGATRLGVGGCVQEETGGRSRFQPAGGHDIGRALAPRVDVCRDRVRQGGATGGPGPVGVAPDGAGPPVSAILGLSS